MPELPEVETTRLGISPHVIGKTISEITVRRYDLRWPISPEVPELEGAEFVSVERRSKYLLLGTDAVMTLLMHLGMSGSLRIISPAEDWKKHDHFAITLSSGLQLRYHDPRRFGLILQVPHAKIHSYPHLNNPHFSALRANPLALSGASRMKFH